VSAAARIAPTHAQTITRAPYLQRGSKDSAVLRFRTDTAIIPTVKVATFVGGQSFSFSTPDAVAGTELAVPLSGLQPSTKYYYKVMSGSTVLAGGDTSHYFVTSPNDGDEPFNVWALGDSGISATLGSGEHPQQARVRDSFLNVTPLQDLSFLMHLGDIAYYEGTDTQFQRGFFDIYPTILRALTTWPTQGNHDYSANAYYNIFSVPQNAEAGGIASSSNRYYSWNFGNAHFVSLNSERTSSRVLMETWLRNDLSANTKTWTIVLFHHPPYTKGSHDSDNVSDSGGKMQYMRETVLPILEQYGVDLVMSGHSHSYERSFLLNGHYGNSSTFSTSHKVSSASGRDDQAYTKSSLTPQANSGTVYLVAGSGGMLDAAVPLNHPAMFTSKATLGSMLLAFNANELTVKFITDTATTDDYFMIRKDPARPRKPSAINVGAGARCELSLTWGTSAGATSYQVYRSNDRHSRGESIASGVTSASYTDPAPTPGATHYYSVRGTNSSGAGPWSELDSGVVSTLDTDGDGVLDCAEQCPNAPSATPPGECRCGAEPLGTFPNGGTNCTAALTPRRVPSSPLVTSSPKIIRIKMDSYRAGVSSYRVTISRRGRVLHRVDTKRSSISLRPNWSGAAWIRYQIQFQSGKTVRETRWSAATRIR
jgi:hypothetical protein